MSVEFCQAPLFFYLYAYVILLELSDMMNCVNLLSYGELDLSNALLLSKCL